MKKIKLFDKNQMKVTIKKAGKTLEADENLWRDIKPGEEKPFTDTNLSTSYHDKIGITKDGLKYIKIITGIHMFIEQGEKDAKNRR